MPFKLSACIFFISYSYLILFLIILIHETLPESFTIIRRLSGKDDFQKEVLTKYVLFNTRSHSINVFRSSTAFLILIPP